MASRLNLQQALETILGVRRVYFHPPETIKLQYPCIIYEDNGRSVLPANNKKYLKFRRYTGVVIDTNPDSMYIDSIIDTLPYSSHDSTYVSDNLTHFAFTIYY